ncbi:MAG: ATP-binding cassette domain-containing protein [Candidatus Competibacterales bacterium]|nr:ATP-binding cassette domain-containing protein [Candidatus Competibacterales bacterium]
MQTWRDADTEARLAAGGNTATVVAPDDVTLPEGILPLWLRGVSFSAGGQRLLTDITLTLEAGVRTVIMGPNGAGKSLLLRICHGLLRPSGGRVDWVCLDGRRVRHAQALVFQRPVLLRRSVAANIGYALAVRGVPRQQRAGRIRESLDRVGMAHLARRPARVLSGGEQQRLALARAWALRPEVLFLDEPTASLDPAAVRAIERVIETFHRDGTKIVMTTHDLGQARRHADEVLFLHRGRLLERTPAPRFFERPASPEARAFLAGELVE